MSISYEELYELAHDEVSEVATELVRKWPGVTTPEDLEQDLWLEIFERKSTQRQLKVAQSKASRRRLIRTLGKQLMPRQKLAYDRFLGKDVYGTNEVREALESISQCEPVGLPVMGDIVKAMWSLAESHPNYFEALRGKYFGGGTTTDRKTLQRARDKLTDEMNLKNKNEATQHYIDRGKESGSMPLLSWEALTEDELRGDVKVFA